MASPEAQDALKKSIDEAKDLGVTGTPTTFINGRRVPGAQDYWDIKSLVAAEIEFAKSRPGVPGMTPPKAAPKPSKE
jgi:predicted DsbA family dithiol-disulfide isomerase